MNDTSTTDISSPFTAERMREAVSKMDAMCECKHVLAMITPISEDLRRLDEKTQIALAGMPIYLHENSPTEYLNKPIAGAA